MLLAGTLGTTTEDPLNAIDGTMGWAADPTRKQDGRYTTTFVQMGARVYVPSLGRFLQVDPIEGGTANKYTYVNDPVNEHDYSGRFFIALVPLIPLITTVAAAVIPTAVFVVKVAPKVIKAAPKAAKAATNFVKNIFKPTKNTRTSTANKQTSNTSKTNKSKQTNKKSSSNNINQNYSKKLENGNIRHYEGFTPARTPGNMAGSQKVQEINALTGNSRYWYQTMDHSGTVRIVRPFNIDVYRHYYFDGSGKFIGAR